MKCYGVPRAIQQNDSMPFRLPGRTIFHVSSRVMIPSPGGFSFLWSRTFCLKPCAEFDSSHCEPLSSASSGLRVRRGAFVSFNAPLLGIPFICLLETPLVQSCKILGAAAVELFCGYPSQEGNEPCRSGPLHQAENGILEDATIPYLP